MLKEVLELYKKSKDKKRKLFAYKSLIAEELEQNLCTYKSLTSIIKAIEACEKNNTNINYTLKVDRNEINRIEAFDDEEIFWRIRIPIVHDKYYDNFIANIAELDEEMFSLSRVSYEKIKDMKHLIELFITNVSTESNEEPSMEDLIGFAKTTLTDTYEAMNVLYKNCTGKELKYHRF